MQKLDLWKTVEDPQDLDDVWPRIQQDHFRTPQLLINANCARKRHAWLKDRRDPIQIISSGMFSSQSPAFRIDPGVSRISTETHRQDWRRLIHAAQGLGSRSNRPALEVNVRSSSATSTKCPPTWRLNKPKR